MARLIYIETSIPSFYHETREEPTMVARRLWTRAWWDRAVTEENLVTSDAVVDELEGGDYPSRSDCVRLVATLPRLPLEFPVEEIVKAYVTQQLMPANPLGDALHLALASYHACDFLVTWNCVHLANANKFGRIARVNSALGLAIPALVTPIEFLGDESDDRSGD